MKFSFCYWGAFICVSLCSINSHTLLPLPLPVLFLLISLILMSYLVLKGDTKLERKAFIVLPLFIFLAFTQVFLTEAPVRRFIAPLIAFLFFPVSIYFIRRISSKQLFVIVKYFIILSVVALFLETSYRFLFPNLDYMAGIEEAEDGYRWIYMYKGPSLIYIDSNGTALHALIVLFFVYFWSEFTNSNFKIYKLALILIVLFSLSRAAWVAMVIGFCYFYFFRNKSLYYKTVLITISIIVFALMMFMYVIPFIQEDLSLLSKFEIVEIALHYFSTSPPLIQSFFSGVGLSMSEDVLGIYAHNLWLVWLIEAGFIVMLLQFALWVQLYVITKKYALIILVPFFVATLSSNLTFAPVFYVVFSIMYCVLNPKINIDKA